MDDDQAPARWIGCRRTALRFGAILIWALLVVPAHASELGALAAQMPSDTWAVLDTAGIDGTTLLAQGASGFITGDASGGCYDPVNQRVLFVGMDHQPGTTTRFVTYELATNRWVRRPDPPLGGGINHGWESTACDVRGRYLYRMNIASGVLWRMNLDTLAWTSLGQNPINSWDDTSGFAGLAFHPERGVAGQLIVTIWCCSGRGVMASYDPATNTWAQLPNSSALHTGYTASVSFAEYSDGQKVTLFGNSGAAHRLATNGTVTTIPAFPGTGCAPRVNRGGIIHADPATGNFVLMCGSSTASWHIYNPITNAWRTMPAPSGVANHALNIASSGCSPCPTWGLVAFPITDHGVIMYVKCAQGRCGVRLYRGGPSGPVDTVAPSTPSGVSTR